MTLQSIYLTIDDSPSSHTEEILEYLIKHNVPAIFFARGEFIDTHPAILVKAIQFGYLIGNHSFSHPPFSEISFETCQIEILKTETLIEELYQQAGVERPIKVVRLPFGDRGTVEESANIQSFLKALDFRPIPFPRHDRNIIDIHWDWDTKDYRSTHIDNPDKYKQSLEAFYQTYKHKEAVMLLHDFDENNDQQQKTRDNFHLFKITMDFLQDRGVTFLSYPKQ